MPTWSSIPAVVAGFFDAAFLVLPRRSADDDAGASPALLSGGDRDGRAEGSVPRGRQHAAGRRAGDREERRARRDGAAARREVLLGGRPQGRRSSRGSTGCTPCSSTRSSAATATRRSASRRWRRGSPSDAFGRPDVAEHAAKAARLAKADLTTDMVFEFTELQGTMGGIYAREEGQPEQVWKAIYHHYLPIGVEADAPPSRAQLGARGGHAGRRSRSPTSSTPSSACHGRGAVDRVARSVRPAPADARHRAHPDGPAGADGRRPRDRPARRCWRAAAQAFGHADGLGEVAAGAAGVRARARALSRSSSAAMPARSVRGATASTGDVSAAARAARRPRRCSGCAASEDFQALAVALQARQEHRARSLKTHGAARARGARPSRPSCALLAELDARRPAHRAARSARGGLSSRRSPSIAGLRPVGRSVLHGSVRHGGRRAGEDRAADADGGLARSHSAISRTFRKSFLKRSRDSRMAKKLAREEVGSSKPARRSQGEPRRRRPRRRSEGGQVRLPLRPQDRWQRYR